MAKMPAVLVVDPDPNSRADVKKALNKAHFTLAGESGLGIDAITLARSVAPDVILVSIEEPVVPCLQTIEFLANALPETPVIAYSSRSTIDIVRKAMKVGARDYLPKPVGNVELSRSIYAVLEAEEKRRMRHARQTENIPAEGTIIAVASLKGGVGKSTLAVNLAITLRRETGQSVALVDTEPNYGDVAILLNMDNVPLAQSITHVARRAEQLDRNTMLDYLLPHSSGVLVLPTATQLEVWQQVQPSDVEKVVHLIAQTQDFVVLDTPAGLNEITATALEAAAIVLLVTTPDIASLKNAVLALNMLRSWGFDDDRIKVVLNHTNAHVSVREDDIKSLLERDVFWSIPFDPVAPTCAQTGQPVAVAQPESKIAQSIKGLALAVSGMGVQRPTAKLRIPILSSDNRRRGWL